MPRLCLSYMDGYKILEKLGEGSFGCVVKAHDRLDGDFVAIKICKVSPYVDKSLDIGGIPYTALRETSMLQTLIHPNIVKLRTVWINDHDDSISLVFDYYPMTLYHYIQSWDNHSIPNRVVHRIFTQLNDALDFAHSKHISHRDLKPHNIMLTSELVVKVGDFGLARQMAYPFFNYTKEIVTLWYRAPEILLESSAYDMSVDMWSMGCILGELLLNKPMFCGNDVVDQLVTIIKILGPIQEVEWPEVKSLPKWKYLRLKPTSEIGNSRRLSTCQALHGPFLSILDDLLQYAPRKRLTTIQLKSRLDSCKAECQYNLK